MVGKTSSLIAECPDMVMCSVDTTVHGLHHFTVPNNETMSWSDKILESAVVSVQHTCI